MIGWKMAIWNLQKRNAKSRYCKKVCSAAKIGVSTKGTKDDILMRIKRIFNED